MDGSVRLYSTLSITAEIGHLHPSCSDYIHGHSWTIESTISGLLDEAGFVSYIDVHRSVMEEIRREFDGRFLNDMLQASAPIPEGLALYAWESLVGRCKLEEVSVSMADIRKVTVRPSK